MDGDLPWEAFSNFYGQVPVSSRWLSDLGYARETLHEGTTLEELQGDKALVQSKSHSEAERRRRERINNQLNSLRETLPNSKKSDKATLLAEVIERVNFLDRQINEQGKNSLMPVDFDDVKVVSLLPPPIEQDASGPCFTVSLSCENRPDILPGLSRVVQGLGLQICQSDLCSLGTRVTYSLILGKGPRREAGREQELPSVAVVLEAMKRVLDPNRAQHLGMAQASPKNAKKRLKSSSSSHSD